MVRKDPKQEKHEVLDMPNLHVMLWMRSMKSRKLVEETYNWRYLYYRLNDEGIEWLRQKLHLPSGVIPITLQRAAAQTGGRRMPQRQAQSAGGW